jgi:hypothetical protein
MLEVEFRLAHVAARFQELPIISVTAPLLGTGFGISIA